MATVTLTISDPTSRTDGTTATPADCKGINVYRADGDSQLALIGTADPAATPPTFVDKNVVPGSYGYAVTAVDAFDRESAHSDLFPVVIAAPPAPLNPPTIVSEVTG